MIRRLAVAAIPLAAVLALWPVPINRQINEPFQGRLAPRQVEEVIPPEALASASATVTPGVVADVAAAPAPTPYAWYLPVAQPYGDCSGATPMGAGVYLDSCYAGTYLIAHQWSTGGAFLGLRPGSLLSVNGRTFRVVDAAVMTVPQAYAQAIGNPAPLTLHTCYAADGSTRWIVRAVGA